jgi:hypothetical protein
MKLTIDLKINADRDRDGETEADEQRLVDMAMDWYRDATDEILIKAKQDGLTVTVHQS